MSEDVRLRDVEEADLELFFEGARPGDGPTVEVQSSGSRHLHDPLSSGGPTPQTQGDETT
jgi:hypothetical protein